MKILVTGGAGFIGSHFVRSLLGSRYPGLEQAQVTVLDAGRAGMAAAAHPHGASSAAEPTLTTPSPTRGLPYRQEEARKRREVAERERTRYRDDQDDEDTGNGR